MQETNLLFQFVFTCQSYGKRMGDGRVPVEILQSVVSFNGDANDIFNAHITIFLFVSTKVTAFSVSF